MLERTLQEFWFTEKQAKIYLICLELGMAPASSIARRSWANRITTYSALKDMCKRWVAYELIKNEIRYYTVISPKELVASEKKKYDKINGVLPDLMSLALTWQANKSKTYYYEWIDWIKELYEDQLSCHIKYWFFWWNKAPKILKEYRNNYLIPKRIDKKIFSKVVLSWWIYNKSRLSKEANREVVIINDDLFTLDCDISLYNGNKVSICIYPSENDISWVIIESEQMYNSLFCIFNLIWRSNKNNFTT